MSAAPVPLRVLGVSGSPRKEATHAMVQAALLGAKSVTEPGPRTDVTTEYICLAGKQITPCNGCDPCIEAGRCVYDDDMQDYYPSLLAADAIIIGTPVYFGMPSALCKAFMERVEAFGITEKVLRLKVGGAIASGGSRNGGQETAMLAINMWFHVNEMLPVGLTAPLAQWGAAANSGHQRGDIVNDRIRLPSTREETTSLQVAWMYGRKVASVAAIVKAGREALDADVPDGPYGWEMPEFPPELDQLAAEAAATADPSEA